MGMGTLCLECDGAELRFRGSFFGAERSVSGEIVFQTGMVGYEESLTDPSYAKQLLVLTYPLVGNYGVSPYVTDENNLPLTFESDKVWPQALIVDRICPEGEHCNKEVTRSLSNYLKEAGVPGLTGIDTRNLTKIIREKGVMRARILVDGERHIENFPYEDINEEDLVGYVSTKTVKRYGKGDLRIMIVDCGLKYNQIRCFLNRGASVAVVPHSFNFEEQFGNFISEPFDGTATLNFVQAGEFDFEGNLLLLFRQMTNHPEKLRPVPEETAAGFHISGYETYSLPLTNIEIGNVLQPSSLLFCRERSSLNWINEDRFESVVVLLAITDCDGLFLSNGPGDPSHCGSLIQRIRKFLDRKIPVFGICLGNQLLASAAGAKTVKLRYGNRGHNQPCVHLDTGRCFITSQNHGFAVDVSSLPSDWDPLFVNENDKTNEGIIHKTLPFFSVQFHPEHCAGPADLECLFDVFLDTVQQYKLGKTVDLRLAIKEKFTFLNKYVVEPQNKVLVLGSGGLSIGQAGEFDYSGAQALKALRDQSVRTVLINPNVATVQTSKGFADRTYFLPLTEEYVTDVIKKERPSGLLCSFGGQTALCCAIDLHKSGILKKYNVQVLGTAIETVIKTEDRELFNAEMALIKERVAPSKAASTLDDAVLAANEVGYPVLVRAAYALGGLGSGFANDDNELRKIVQVALSHSSQVLIDKSLKGWKEIEYEVVRDAYDNCITVCNMENIDPLGIHTGESMVVAPSQTLSDYQYQKLRSTAIKVIRHLGVIGECNIQYAVNPDKFEYYIVEVNARLSRSSALASKATGYPLAYVAALLALGGNLSRIRNKITGTTTACFEPSLDYVVVKIPRWDLNKFARVSTRIGSSMKSVGEVMGIGRSFEEAFQKGLRMVNENVDGFSPQAFMMDPVDEDFEFPTDKRVFALARALFSRKYDIQSLHELTKIDRWFFYRMQNIISIHRSLEKHSLDDMPRSLLLDAKRCGFSDKQIANIIGSGQKKFNELNVRKLRHDLNIKPFVKQIDTVAAEWPAQTNYLYLTYNGHTDDVSFDMKNGVIVLGSGVYRIGSSVEFDACSVACINELKRLGYQPIAINCNPETVSTDYDMCSRLYFDEVSFEVMADIYEREHPKGVIVAFGGQLPNNIAGYLARPSADLKINVFGTSPDSIETAENRFKFSRLLDRLQIMQPRWRETSDIAAAEAFCDEVGYPCIIRPSYVLSGAAMNVAHSTEDFRTFLKHAVKISNERPIVVSEFISNAKEIDVDAVAFEGKVLALAVCEHVENAGVHSGDATLVTPPQDMTSLSREKIQEIVYRVAEGLHISGPFNMQLIAKNDELKVIEANLRASRSFPFISKTYDFDFVALATRCIMAQDGLYLRDSLKPIDLFADGSRVGVKVPQFSFSRLAGADVMLGVEMASTGEVACFGTNRYEAYLKALISTGFVLPKKTIFVSIGGYHAKAEMLNSIRALHELGFELLASKGTADYFSSNNIPVKGVDWCFDERDEVNEKTASQPISLSDAFCNKAIHLVINLPIRGSGAYRVSVFRTHGYRVRRMAIDSGIPLITDIKCAKLFIEALRLLKGRPEMNPQTDSISSSTLQRLPGFIDVHVHMREPGQEHKETWYTGTCAAVAGGVTMVLAMPNTKPPITNADMLKEADNIASKSAVVDYGLFFGGTPRNVDVAYATSSQAAGLKLYLNDTFSDLKMESFDDWMEHFKYFPSAKPIVCHAESGIIAQVLAIAKLCNRSVHIAHVSTASEIQLIRMAKDAGWPVTCEVCPHHLFLTRDAVPKALEEVRPRLGLQDDCDALWNNLDYIDCFATDHAPHTFAEKRSGLPGFPSVEYMLPLLLTAVSEGRLTLNQLIDRLYYNPLRIFGLPLQDNTYIEVDMDEEWIIPENGGFSKAGWSPYSGKKVKGRVRTVVIRGEEAFVDGKVIAHPGFGKNVFGAYYAPVFQNIAPLSVTERKKKRNIVLARTSESEQTHVESFGSKSRPPSSRLSFKLAPQQENPFKDLNVIEVEGITKSMVDKVLELATRYRNDIDRRENSLLDVLKNYKMALLFYEASTRTANSFTAAMQQLGGTSVFMDERTSSVRKGETLEDSTIVMSGYADIVVLRHPEAGAAARAARVIKKPLINAGDGVGQHPSQALLDVFTIRDEIGTVHNAKIAMVGDLRNGRTVHSLAKLLCVFREVTIHYVYPSSELSMPEDVVRYVSDQGQGTKQEFFTDFVAGIRGVDVIYMTRIQKERFEDPDEYDRVKNRFVLTQKILDDVSHLRSVGKDLVRHLPIVMHPLPRVNEVEKEVDSDVRAAYFRQARNGLFVRMALLSLVLDRFPSSLKPNDELFVQQA